jgi:hypothetical protein
MDRNVDLARQQGLLDLLGEQALAADLAQRAILHLVAGGLNDADLDGAGRGQVRMGGDQARARLVRLGKGER